MKKITSLLVFLFAAISFVSAQEIQFVIYKAGDCRNAASAEEKAGANMTQTGSDATTWNYGTIKNGSTGYRYFKFTNTGSGPLVISDAKGSCGCTVPTWPKEPIMPGQTEYIKVNYDTKRTGAFTKYVTLTTNAKSNTTSRLKIEGTVDAPPTDNSTATPK
ncbi:MAG: DUF1573 domain-containing protein [Thermonemataceae bacterium]|nr:DUF1573 domain-containing protein [Thermonemataceae bacterium]